MSFLLESVEGGAVRGRYSIIGLEPDLIWRTRACRPRSTARRVQIPDRFAALPRAAARCPARADRRKPHRAPDGLPPMAAGLFGYLGYDMVRLMEGLPTPNPDPLGIAGRDPDPADPRSWCSMRCKDAITVVTPVRPETGVTAKVALARAGERLTAIVDALDPPLDKATARVRSGPARGRAAPPTPAPAEYARDGAQRQGLHRRRRHFPGRAVAALRDRRSICRRSRSIARCGGSIRRRFSISSISAASRSPALARKSWCGCATARSPSVRSPARGRAARRRTRTRRSNRNCLPIRKSAPSI